MSIIKKLLCFDIDNNRLNLHTSNSEYAFTIHMKHKTLPAFSMQDAVQTIRFTLNDIQVIRHILDPNYLSEICKSIVIQLKEDKLLTSNFEVISIALHLIFDAVPTTQLNLTFNEKDEVFLHK